MMSRFGTLLALVGCGAFASPARADVYVVDPNGNDGTGIGSAGAPWATLSHACGEISAGEHTIQINAGEYADNATCSLPLGVDISGAGRDLVTIRSAYGDWYLSAVSDPISDGNHEISGITLDGNDRALEHGMRFEGRNNVEVHDCRFRNIRDRAINVHAEYTDWEPPATRVSGISIHDLEVTACASHYDADNSSGAIHVNATTGTTLYNLVMDESTTTGQCIKAVFGWNQALELHHSSFTVGPQGATNGCVIELWGHSDDSEIHHNVFNNGFVSLVSGDKGAGTWALNFHHNVLNNTSATECSVDDLWLHDNLLLGPAAPYADHIACWGCFAFWHTWIYSEVDLHNILIDHNVFYGSAAASIFFNDGVDYADVRVFNNTIDAPFNHTWGGHGIALNALGRTWDGVDIANNIVTNSESWAVWSPGGSTSNMQAVNVHQNLFAGNGGGDVRFNAGGEITISDNLSQAAGIVGSGDRPQPYYEASDGLANIVDAGVVVPAVLCDTPPCPSLPYSGAAPDIGAFEYGELPGDDGGGEDGGGEDGGGGGDADPVVPDGGDPTAAPDDGQTTGGDGAVLPADGYGGGDNASGDLSPTGCGCRATNERTSAGFELWILIGLAGLGWRRSRGERPR